MNSWLSPLYSLLFLALWRVSYEAANNTQKTHHAEDVSTRENRQSEAPLTSQREWAEKAVLKYKECQPRKWESWSKSMFEDK
ncbi:hypothetical protein [Dehalogenimonas sp. 4OHTPN]|uniref:Secreted protein n=1 Tax=Dehalogenimonas sp. 4OHTPN TaxID=3166643 RepID=A0AAU8GB18_9CHLR